MRSRDSRHFGRWLLPFAYLGLTSCFGLERAVFLNRGYVKDDLVREEALEEHWAREQDIDAAGVADEPPEPAVSIEQADVTHPATKWCSTTGSCPTCGSLSPDVEAITLTWHWFGAVDVSSDELRLKLVHLGHGDLMDEEYLLKKLPPQEVDEAGEEAQD